jgi:hypothetical protein
VSRHHFCLWHETDQSARFDYLFIREDPKWRFGAFRTVVDPVQTSNRYDG